MQVHLRPLECRTLWLKVGMTVAIFVPAPQGRNFCEFRPQVFKSVKAVLFSSRTPVQMSYLYKCLRQSNSFLGCPHASCNGLGQPYEDVALPLDGALHPPQQLVALLHHPDEAVAPAHVERGGQHLLVVPVERVRPPVTTDHAPCHGAGPAYNTDSAPFAHVRRLVAVDWSRVVGGAVPDHVEGAGILRVIGHVGRAQVSGRVLGGVAYHAGDDCVPAHAVGGGAG